MSRQLHRVIALTGLLLVGIVPAFPAPVRTPISRRPTKGRLQPIVYHRTGGLRPEDFWIEVTVDGRIRSYSLVTKDGREERRDVRAGHLTAAQQRQLARAFTGWNRLADRYLPLGTVPDGRTMRLRYGRKTVTVADGAPVIPAVYERAERTLEDLTRQVCRPVTVRR